MSSISYSQVNFRDQPSLQQYHHEWVETALFKETLKRDLKWTETLAVGSENFVKNFQAQQCIKTRYRSVENIDDTYLIKEPATPYTDTFG